MPEKKVQLPLAWGARQAKRPEDLPDWIEPYQRFLDKYKRIPWISGIFPFNLEFAETLPVFWPLIALPIPGDVPEQEHVHGRTVSPFTIRLSMRTRSSLFFGLRPAPDSSPTFVAENSRGARILFACFAHLEAMHQHPLAWPIRWVRQRPRMEQQAQQRGLELLDLWAWNILGQPEAKPGPLPLPAPRIPQVMVVDDHNMWRTIASKMLEAHGAQATLASSGYEAIRIAAHRDFDVILMDLHMPGLDGREVTRALREMGCDQPILNITGADQDHTEDVRAGLDGSMYKPWSFDGFGEMLRRWGPAAPPG